MGYVTASYKEDPIAPVLGDSTIHRPHQPSQRAGHVYPSHHRPGNINTQPHPGSPHPGGPYPSPHPSNSLNHHHSSYGPPAPTSSGHPPPDTHFYQHPGSYGPPTPHSFTSSDTPDMMAATHMHRPFQGHAMFTPQSQSPASVASSQSHDQHRAMFAQPPSTHMGPQLYQYPGPYSMGPVQSTSYAQHSAAPPQHQAIAQQPLLPTHMQGPSPLQPQSQAPTPIMNNSTCTKIEPSTMQRPPESTAPQRAPQAPITPSHSSSNGSLTNGTGASSAPPSASGANPGAAPGPIRATTPLVVRQDNDGVQWIAFEYSRDRVKMEYTIRCDVESVNTDNLPAEFKTDNCVYPRAYCGKDQYKGNRLIYESECNTVGWALAELNLCLRGKRGLIQRAVDSWRNSNSNMRLRSRRVRRMAKAGSRKSSNAGTVSAVPSSGVPGTPTGMPSTPNTMAAPEHRQASNGMMTQQHGRADGVASGNPNDTNGVTSTFDPSGSQAMKAQPAPPSDIRQRHVFQGYPSHPGNAMAASIPPPLHNGLDPIGTHTTPHTSMAASLSNTRDKDLDTILFGGIPESKRRKFITVDKLRVQVNIDQVNMDEAPDSYREKNSVYPRSYFPVQTPNDGPPVKGNRFTQEDFAPSGALVDESTVVGRTMVPIPLLEGEAEIAVPRIGHAKRARDMILNDMGHRMSWNQGKLFADKGVFLQKSLDAYRHKFRSSIIDNKTNPSDVPRHFETRLGKRRWLERRGDAYVSPPPNPPMPSVV